MLNQIPGRYALWIGFLAVLVPLGVLLGLQYVWLNDLQRKSAVAEKAYLQNYLEAVSSRVEYFYRAQAERALNVPGTLLSKAGPDKVGRYFAKKRPEGAKALFVVNFVNKDWGGVLVFDPRTEAFVEPDDTSMLQAIFVAMAPWQALSYKKLPLQSHGISVEEKDPANRIVINPITDDSDHVLGIVGMIVDIGHFRRHVLTTAVEKSVPGCLGEGSRQDLKLTVRDGDGRLVLGVDEDDELEPAVTGRIGFMFSDWQLGLRDRNMTPEEWAKSNFVLNISMSALLALLLIGGIVLALRTASREIKLSRMKSDFVSNVSHELRTPLASIRVFGEFLRLGRSKSDEKTREYGEYIETESRRLTQLINNILDFSKIESGAKTYTFRPSSIERIVSGTTKTLQVSLKHKAFDLRFVPPAGAIPPIAVDADAIGQALANLVDNAVKYSKRPSAIVVSLDHSANEVRISVRDHGIGISREEQKKIFERFHRVCTGLVHDVKGSGLGLSIVRHIAQAHGGRVTVESDLGHGSTFTIHLPCREARAPAAADVPARADSVELAEET